MTTSWDDGHPCDLRLAGELAARGLPGTFYVPLANQERRDVLSAPALRDLAGAGFEIGAHTVTHRVLTGLSPRELSSEVRGSKQLLEELLGREVRMFCYPRGRYDSNVIRCVEESGFAGARTTRMLARAGAFERYEMPASLQAFPHPPLNYVKNLGKRRDVEGMGRYFKQYLRCGDWVELGKKLFQEVMEHGGIWHLYGHSWEIEEFALWGQLAELLDHVSRQPGVVYGSNGEVLDWTCGIPTAIAGAA
ncbi:MAG: polysaccharide deacetylase family protein [Candidatus Acidiferrales bacterium]